MVDRDPTPGEINVRLDGILEMLREMRDTIATKEFVNAKFDGYNDRVSRLESDQKEWAAVSTAAHVELDKDSKARHAETLAEVKALEARVLAHRDKDKAETAAHLKEQSDRQFQIEQAQKQTRSNRVLQWSLLAVGAVLSVVTPIVVSILINGGTS